MLSPPTHRRTAIRRNLLSGGDRLEIRGKTKRQSKRVLFGLDTCSNEAEY